uniref:Ig-like domain-containing protein n=1 Tax=Hucho hucho TaxID=62062 RepID=A0A4W5JLX9_9TELE
LFGLMFLLGSIACLLTYDFWNSPLDVDRSDCYSVHSVQPGDTMQILYRASQDIGNDTALYQFKPVHAPRGLIHDSNQKYPYTPSRFSGILDRGTGTGRAGSTTGTGILERGAGTGRTGHATAAPQVSLFAPTGKDLTRTGGQTTLLCLINNFYPDQVTLSWTMDGKGVSGDQQDSQSVRIPDRTYSTSSTLTLPRSTWESGEMYVCQVQH